MHSSRSETSPLTTCWHKRPPLSFVFRRESPCQHLLRDLRLFRLSSLSGCCGCAMASGWLASRSCVAGDASSAGERESWREGLVLAFWQDGRSLGSRADTQMYLGWRIWYVAPLPLARSDRLAMSLAFATRARPTEKEQDPERGWGPDGSADVALDFGSLLLLRLLPLSLRVWQPGWR